MRKVRSLTDVDTVHDVFWNRTEVKLTVFGTHRKESQCKKKRRPFPIRRSQYIGRKQGTDKKSFQVD